MDTKTTIASAVVAVIYSLGHAGVAQAAVSYAPPVSTTVATPNALRADPEFIAKGDFNNDGDMDLVTANETDDRITVLLSNGAGGFSSVDVYTVGDAPRQVAVGDLNGDGYNDLVVPNTAVTAGNITVLLNDGDGTFTVDSTIDIAALAGAGARPTSPVIANLNGDAHLDIAVSNDATHNVQILHGQGDGTFTPGATIAVGTKPTNMTAASVNTLADAHIDLVVSNYDDGTVSVLLGDGSGGFSEVLPRLSSGSNPWSVHIGSVDTVDDAIPDLVLVNYTADSTVKVFKGNGDGTFVATPLSSTSVPLKPHSVEITHLNNDAFVDLVVASDNDPNSTPAPAVSVSVLLGDGTGTFPTVKDYPVEGQPNGVVSVDLDGNNLIDLAVADGLVGTVDVLLSVPTIYPPEAADGYLQVASADVPTTNVQTGTLIGTDDDGALLKYAIDSPSVNGTVVITNAATGEYTYTPSAGNFVPDSFTFTVDDGTGPSVAGTIQVVQNDFSPAITSNGGGASASVTVNENQTAVTTVTAIDDDVPAQTLIYSISGGADAAKFSIDSGTGVLAYASAPDFESPTDAGADNVYDVQVQVTDGNGGTDVQDIAVTVADINEAPVITSNGGGASASVTVNENQTAVTTVVAADVDAGQTLTYSISGGADAARFSIDSASGVLSFASAPDFETPNDVGANNVYDVQVAVTDNGTGSLTDVQNIAVTVADVVEAPVNVAPVITSAASVIVDENQTAVTTVTATDADLPAQTLTYSISGGADAGDFNINASTGVLTFAAAPDFEAPTDADTNNVYEVQVQVSDGNVGGTAVQDIAVTVADVNESPTNTPPTISGTPATTVVVGYPYSFIPTASDVDAGDTLTFLITNKPAWASFDAATGELSGTPTSTDVGTTMGIVITVSDGTASDALPVFDLAVISDNDSNGDGITDVEAIAIGLDPVLTDTDGDGISDAVEVGVDPANPLDSDGDGVIDALEFESADDATILAFIVPAPTAAALTLPDLSNQRVSLDGNGAGMTAHNNGTSGIPLYAESDIAVADAGYTYPFGLYDFSVAAAGGTSTVTLTLPAGIDIPANAVVRKLGVGNQWRTLDSTTAVIDRTSNTVTLTLTDNDWVVDLDDTVGTIRDPFGVAVPVASSSGGGGGGCALVTGPRQAGFDPVLPLLALGSLLYLRRPRRRNAA